MIFPRANRVEHNLPGFKGSYLAFRKRQRGRAAVDVLPGVLGGVLRRMQSGNIRSYATWVLFGGVLVMVALGVLGGVR